jgi:hypothetical protein
MKLQITLFLLIFTVNIGVSQEINSKFNKIIWSNDTIIKKGEKFKLSNWAIEIAGGAAKIFNDKQTQKYLGNYWANSAHVSFFYKNIFLSFNNKIGSLNINDTLMVGEEKVNNSIRLDIFNMAISFGYNFDLTQSLTLKSYVGLLYSSFSPNDYNNTQTSTGFTGGLSLNKYFTLRPKRQLGIYINGSYNQSNYDEWNKGLGKYYYAVDIGIEYKFWILKKIK